MKVPTLLKKDHKRLLALFSKYARASKKKLEQRRELFDEIRNEIRVHAQMEQDVVYAALEQSGETEIVQRALDQHREIERMLDELSRLAPGDVEFENRIHVLRENVEVHAAFEESELFDALTDHYDDDELEAMARESEERRELARTARGHAS